jgi:hypothetical protein
MTTIAKLQRQMEILDAKLSAILKAGRDGEYEVYPEGAEFEKEPEEDDDDDDEPTSQNDGKGGVPYEGKPRRGDWYPGSGTPGPGKMTPERASQVLQRYADHSNDTEEDDPNNESDELYARLEDEEVEKEEEEDLQEATHKFAQRLAKRFPRASNASLEKTLEGALHSSHAGFDPAFGREREMMKRAQAAAMQEHRRHNGYTESELAARLHNRFGKAAADRYLGRR